MIERYWENPQWKRMWLKNVMLTQVFKHEGSREPFLIRKNSGNRVDMSNSEKILKLKSRQTRKGYKNNVEELQQRDSELVF